MGWHKSFHCFVHFICCDMLYGPVSVARVAGTPACNINCALWCTLFIMECVWSTSPTLSLPPLTTWSVLCRQHGVSATEMSYIRGRVCVLLLRPTRMECSVFNTLTLPTVHVSENYSKHTSSIQDLSLVHLSVMDAWTCVCKAGSRTSYVIIVIIMMLMLTGWWVVTTQPKHCHYQTPCVRVWQVCLLSDILCLLYMYVYTLSCIYNKYELT